MKNSSKVIAGTAAAPPRFSRG